jgi:hypothetical protein
MMRNLPITRGARAFVRATILLMLPLVLATPPVSHAAAPGGPALVIEPGAVWTMGDFNTMSLGVNLLNSGTFNPSLYSRVFFVNGGDLLVTGVPAFWHVLMETPGTVTFAMPSSCNTLVMEQGKLILGGGDLTATTLLGGTYSSFVVTPDTTAHLVAPASSTTPTTFPVGQSVWNPITLQPTIGTDQFKVSVMDVPPTNGISPGMDLRRAWLVRQANAPGADGTILMDVQWALGEEGPGFVRATALAYQWMNGGWTPRPGVRAGEGFPPLVVDTLRTNDVGLWTLASPGTAGVETLEPAPGRVELAAATPNPCVRTSAIRYGLPREGHVTLAVFDVTGHRVATLVDGEQGPGWHVATFEASRMAAGIYFSRLECGGRALSQKLVVVR